MLAVYLIRHADIPGAGEKVVEGAAEAATEVGNLTISLVERALPVLAARAEEEVGRLGGGVGKALEEWAVETWLYIVLLSVVYGAVVGLGWCYALKYALRR